MKEIIDKILSDYKAKEKYLYDKIYLLQKEISISKGEVVREIEQTLSDFGISKLTKFEHRNKICLYDHIEFKWQPHVMARFLKKDGTPSEKVIDTYLSIDEFVERIKVNYNGNNN